MPFTSSNFSAWTNTELPLEAERLTDQVSFGDSNVSFHWSDFREGCRLWQTRIAIEPGLRRDYEKRLHEMQKLKNLPIWIRAGKTTTQTNLFDLYEGFICDQMWHGDDVFPHAHYDISLISPSGPFKEMPITNCFNLQTYRDFVMVFLLQDKLPRRDFRLRVKSKVLAEYGPNFNDAGLLELEQITANGLLFKTTGAKYYSGMAPHHEVRLLFKTSFLAAATQAGDSQEFRREIEAWTSNPFYTHDKAESFIFNCKDVKSSARFDGNATQECYLMVSFDTIAASNGPLKQRLQSFVKVAQKNILEMLEKKNAA